MATDHVLPQPNAPVAGRKQRLVAALQCHPDLWIGFGLFLVALTLRLWRLDVPITVDEPKWIDRGIAFFAALLDGDRAGTYLRHHPGVTNMWLVGGGLSLRLLSLGISPLDPAVWQRAFLQAQMGELALFTAARGLAAVVTAGCFAAFFLLARRLFGRPVALLAAAILLVEPFFLAWQRTITTDANLTNFLWLSLLAFLMAWQPPTGARRERPLPDPRWLVASGALFGLAALSKLPAVLSLPALVIWAVVVTARERGTASTRWLRLAAGLLIWGLSAAAVFVALWPALWTDLPGTVARLLADMDRELAGHNQFFLGQTTDAPGPAFYPLVLLFRLSPLLLASSVFGVITLLIPAAHHTEGRRALLAVLLFLATFAAGLTLNATKIDRYVLPLLPGLALVAASGLWYALVLLARRLRSGRATPIALLAGATIAVVLCQAAVLLPHVPYYLTYYNPLLGGAARAQHVLMLGNAELMDLGAAWLNGQAGVEEALVAAWYPETLSPYHDGPSSNYLEGAGEPRWLAASYVLVYVNQSQRRLPLPEIVEYFEAQEPLFVAASGGVPHVSIYAGPAGQADDIGQLAEPADLRFGPSVRLAGYRLETPQVAAGGEAVIALYWQTLEPFEAPDFSVYAGVRDEAGRRVGRSDSLPVAGFLPVDHWTPDQLIRDVHRVPIDPDAPPGEYMLEVGWFSPQLGQGLDASDASGPRGQQVPLTTLHVRKAPPAERQ